MENISLDKHELEEYSKQLGKPIEEIIYGIPINDEEISLWATMTEDEMLKAALLPSKDDTSLSPQQRGVGGAAIERVRLAELNKRLKQERSEQKTGVGDDLDFLLQTIEKDDENGKANEILDLEKRFIITVSHDKMEAKIRIMKLRGERIVISVDNIKNALAKEGVIKGIRYDFIERLAANPIFNMPFKIANGRAAVNGNDGEINFFKDIKKTMLPVIDKKGNVDYHNLDIGIMVKKGEKLCEICSPTIGIDGYDIYGNVIKAKEGKEIIHPIGENVCYDETESFLIATSSGEMVYENGKVSVNKILRVESCDVSTGDIVFEGSVEVIGNVSSGYAIRCKDDIKISGMVEGAFLEAGGNITIAKGMNGGLREKGNVVAGGIIKSSFFENVTIQSSGSVYADTLINCNVKTLGDVEVHGRRGSIIGGRIESYGKVQADRIGNNAQVYTEISIKSKDTLYAIIEETEKVVAEMESTIKKLENAENILRNSECDEVQKKIAIVRAKLAKKSVSSHLEKLNEKKSLMEEKVRNKGTVGIVKAFDCIFSNVMLEFDGKKLRNKRNCYKSFARILENEIKIISAENNETNATD